MSYLVLARKYRPQTFGEVVEQAHVTRTLANAITANRVAHAILFSGPRGTGKTTIARILAKAMNCEKGPTPTPCNACTSCTEITAGNAVDVFEIDGASNNSVDQIRELRENIKYMPARSRFKIYIIDEVHMLSLSAFNALLKTLEEPPAHVLFMFATTEPHKIPVTILSRCQRHDLRRIDAEAIAARMSQICKQEGMSADTESLWLIAREAGGSMRDALSLLDQIMASAEGKITRETIVDLLGVIDRQMIFDLSGAALRGDVPTILGLIDDIYDRGLDMKKLHQDLLEHFRNLLVIKIGKQTDRLVDLPAHEIEAMREQVKNVSGPFLDQIFNLIFREESTLRLSDRPRLALEMLFIRLSQIQPALSIDELIDRLDRLRADLSERPAPGPADRIDSPPAIDPVASAPSAAPSAGAIPPPEADLPTFDAGDDLSAIWDKLLKILSGSVPALAATLAKSTLTHVGDDRIEIEVHGNGFSLNMVRRPKNREILKQVCSDFFGHPVQVKVRAGKNPSGERKQEKQAVDKLKKEALNHPLVTDAIEIFDGKIVDVKINGEVD